MAYSSIPKPSLHVNTKLYTGDGGTQSVTGVGFQPDWTWIKNRGSTDSHNVYDAVRGVTKYLLTNNNVAEGTTSGVTAFNSDGFSVGNNSMTNSNSNNYVSWNWKANGAGSSNTDGSRATTVSVNTTAGFSVGTCASLATNNDTLGHGLGAVPKMIIVKNKQASGNWFVYHHKLPTGSVGQGSYLTLNATDSYSDGSIWNSTAPTSSVFTMKGGDFATGESLVFYAFAEKQGYSKFGSYTGNGNADGPFIYTGFKPAFVMLKNASASGKWLMLDSKRPTAAPGNPNNARLFADVNNAENTSSNMIDLLSNGFKIRTNDSDHNGSGNTNIYMAFAENPLVANSGTDGVPATAR